MVAAFWRHDRNGSGSLKTSQVMAAMGDAGALEGVSDAGVVEAIVREVMWRVQAGNRVPGPNVSFEEFVSACQIGFQLRRDWVAESQAETVGR